MLDAVPLAQEDLHGCTGDEAVARVRNFVATWQRRVPGAVVAIITGRGNRSANGRVLRERVRRLIKSELRVLVEDSTLTVDEGGFLVRLR